MSIIVIPITRGRGVCMVQAHKAKGVSYGYIGIKGVNSRQQGGRYSGCKGMALQPNCMRS